MKCRSSGENPEGFQNLQGLEKRPAPAVAVRTSEAKGQGFPLGAEEKEEGNKML